MSFPHFRFPTQLILSLAILALAAVTGKADPGPPGGGFRPGEDGDSEKRKEMWESLSDEEREKLLGALRKVWTDPAVLGAREEVRQASEGYREAVRAAIGKADPEVADLLAGFQASMEGKAEGRMGDGPPGGRPAFRRGHEYSILPPDLLEKLDPEKREKVKAAEAAARDSERVEVAKKAFDELRQRDEELRTSRMEAHRRMRRAIIESMIEADPEMAALLESLGPKRGPMPPPGEPGTKPGPGKGEKKPGPPPTGVPVPEERVE